MAKNYPIIEKHSISYKKAYKLIKQCQAKHPEVSEKTLNYFQWPLSLYSEVCQAYGEDCFARTCFGWDENGEDGPCFVPIMFISNETGRLLPPPGSNDRNSDDEDPLTLDVSQICPPFCDPVPNGFPPEPSGE